MTQRSRSNRIPLTWSMLLLLTIIGSVVIAMLLVRAYDQTPQARSQRNSPSALLGTWTGVDGNVLNLRPDGKGRARFSWHRKDEYEYFEWIHRNGKLEVYQCKNSYDLKRFALRAIVNDTPTSVFDLIEITKTELKMSTNTGEVITFSSSIDTELEAAS